MLVHEYLAGQRIPPLEVRVHMSRGARSAERDYLPSIGRGDLAAR